MRAGGEGNRGVTLYSTLEADGESEEPPRKVDDTGHILEPRKVAPKNAHRLSASPKEADIKFFGANVVLYQIRSSLAVAASQATLLTRAALPVAT